jgi:hypothetical protein
MQSITMKVTMCQWPGMFSETFDSEMVKRIKDFMCITLLSRQCLHFFVVGCLPMFILRYPSALFFALCSLFKQGISSPVADGTVVCS